MLSCFAACRLGPDETLRFAARRPSPDEALRFAVGQRDSGGTVWCYPQMRHPPLSSRPQRHRAARTRRAGTQDHLRRRCCKPRPKIQPLRILLFDQFQLPAAQPPLHPLLLRNRFDDIAVNLEIHQHLHAVLLGEARHQTIPMLLDTAQEIVGDPHVKRPISLTRQNIQKICVILHGAPQCWVPALAKELGRDDKLWFARERDPDEAL